MRNYFSLPILSPQIYHVSCFQNQNLWANSRGGMGVKTYIHVHKHVVSLSHITQSSDFFRGLRGKNNTNFRFDYHSKGSSFSSFPVDMKHAVL